MLVLLLQLPTLNFHQFDSPGHTRCAIFITISLYLGSAHLIYRPNSNSPLTPPNASTPSGAAVYNTSPPLSNPSTTLCPPSLSTIHSTNSLPTSLFVPSFPSNTCAGLSITFSSVDVPSSSRPSAKTAMSSRTSSSMLHHVPRSTSVYSPNRLAALSAWNGNST